MNINHLRRLSEILGHKWDLVILAHLAERPLRYTQITGRVRQTDTDLADGVLSKSLKRLAANGLIRRQQAIRHRVYDLTPRGRNLMATLGTITDFDDEDPPGGLRLGDAP